MATSEREDSSAPVFRSGTFSKLLQDYHFELVEENMTNISYGANNPNVAGYNIFAKPFYYLRNGFINLINHPLNHALWRVNDEGEIWTSSTINPDVSGYLVLYNAVIYPTFYASSTYGLSLHCLLS